MCRNVLLPDLSYGYRSCFVNLISTQSVSLSVLLLALTPPLLPRPYLFSPCSCLQSHSFLTPPVSFFAFLGVHSLWVYLWQIVLLLTMTDNSQGSREELCVFNIHSCSMNLKLIDTMLQ